MNRFFEQLEAQERIADEPGWKAFWASYKPLIVPLPPRRPNPYEISKYLKENPQAAVA
jgi:hypothetical protein